MAYLPLAKWRFGGHQTKALLILAILILNACSVSFSGNEDLDLSPEEIDQLKYQANSGFGEAAHRLATYYSFVKMDESTSLHWETLSAQEGYPVGMYSLGVTLMEQKTENAQRQSQFWLEQADARGITEAHDALLELANQKFSN